MAGHEHPVALAYDETADHDHAAPGDACPGCDDHAADCDEAQHHCCPGYVLGHLPAAWQPLLVCCWSTGRCCPFDPRRVPFSSRIPEGSNAPRVPA